ncbi:MAG: DUF362 domain-containing protein [Armatimonadetes bacterium]|nr:DUF362 domain-containing protein [Armatimonadota bacterium]MDW8121748.1 DUF362 domain-containing protein [Armatimonadota bacterium]
MKRRQLFAQIGQAVAVTGLSGTSVGWWLGWLQEAQAAPVSQVAVAKKDAPGALVRKAVSALGGMQKFVKKGSRVLVKPNIAFARAPEIAANTNPEVVAEIIRLCFQAGARQVIVLDHTIDPPRITYEMSGIADAVQRSGGQLVTVGYRDFVPMEIRKGRILSAYDVRVLRHALEADVLINVPVAKSHSMARLTLGMKNLMGLVLDRASWHGSGDLHQCIADFVTAVRPHLTIVDAVRVLVSGGPKGPGRVEQKDTVIAGSDIVAVDAVATDLFGMKPEQIPHIINGQRLGIGVADLKRIKVVTV